MSVLYAKPSATSVDIDLLVNNAGVAPNVRADLLDAGEASFDRLFAINLKGPYFLTQLVAKQMLQQERDAEGARGRIVNITSISAYTASTNRGDYCMVKAGLSMMTKLFADRLANDSINVYEIRPGVIATDMTGGVKEKYDKLILQMNEVSHPFGAGEFRKTSVAPSERLRRIVFRSPPEQSSMSTAASTCTVCSTAAL